MLPEVTYEADASCRLRDIVLPMVAALAPFGSVGGTLGRLVLDAVDEPTELGRTYLQEHVRPLAAQALAHLHKVDLVPASHERATTLMLAIHATAASMAVPAGSVGAALASLQDEAEAVFLEAIRINDEAEKRLAAMRGVAEPAVAVP